MAYIESHQEVDDHPKTRKAARLLGIGIPQMVGHLHIFWHWAFDYAPDGDVTDYPPEDLADGARWEGDPALFVQALIDCRISKDKAGYLERTDDGRLLLHDWREYGGKLIAKRQADAERKRADREAARAGTSTDAAEPIQGTSTGHPTDGAGRVKEKRVKESREEESREEERVAPAAPPRLPDAAQVYVDNGGTFPTGKLNDGTAKKERAIQFIADHVPCDPESLALWGRVVAGYCAQWSPKSYTVMINDYFAIGRVPGQPKPPANGNGRANGINPGLEAARREYERLEREGEIGNKN